MALTAHSAARKDQDTANSGVTLQHRHFSFIAQTVAGLKPQSAEFGARGEEYSRWLHIVNHFADACAQTNPKFDRARFEAACGVKL